MNEEKCRQIVLLGLLVSQASVASDPAYQFSCGTPSDPYGRAIPVPTGNLGFVAVPGGMCGGAAEFTWDYAGTLVDGDRRHSFMANIVQGARLAEDCVNGICGSYSLGFHGLHFAFNQGDSTYFLNSLYGGDSPAATWTALTNSLDWIYSSSTLDHFEVATRRIASSGGEATWSIASNGVSPVTPLYLGYPGQPGHQFRMRGEGSAFLWKIENDGAKIVAPYNYSVDIEFIDERGVVGQGYGGGYVGPQLVEDGVAIPEEQIQEKTRISEYEIAQPRLKVLSWDIAIRSDKDVVTGFESSYLLEGADGMLWNDLGPVKKAYSTQETNVLTKPRVPLPKVGSLEEMEQIVSLVVPAATRAATTQKSLYHGNWIPIQFTQGRYEGAAMVFNVYWDKYVRRPSDQTTDSFGWSKAGLGSIYTGLLPDNVTSAYSLTELMLPGLPAIAVDDPHATGWLNPFEVRFLEFVDEKYNPAYPWVTTLQVTIRAHSRLRHALASYANLRSGQWDQPIDFADTDLVLRVVSLYPQIQNTMFSSQVAQYYESAATAFLDGVEVGYAWIEHMGRPD